MSRTSRRRILFLQLPCVDNDVTGPSENVNLAAVYLRNAIERSAIDQYYEVMAMPDGTLDDQHLVEQIAGLAPDVLCVTLYLWNVERSVAVLRKLKSVLSDVQIVVGGPEVARNHPFLFRTGIADVAVTGEGEAVIVPILDALRRGWRRSLPATAWRVGERYALGTGRPAAIGLADILPPPDHESNKPNADGIGYLESGRGCPLRCAFCCYNQRRRTAAYLDAGDVIKRVRILRDRGAKEIRFIDPTFNSNPHFDQIIAALARLNTRKTLQFFAELLAETVTPHQADLLAAANFSAIEVGVQSRDDAVLRAVRRPTDLSKVDRGIKLLADRGIKLTVDIMCGLPEQGMADISTSLRWAAGIPLARVQFLHTLLLPGTELMEKGKALGLSGQVRPPYRVVSTRWLSQTDILKAEEMAFRMTGMSADCPTRRFIGTKLPDLFPERVTVSCDAIPADIPGRRIRRALIFTGENLFLKERAICGLIRRAIKTEPYALWQFVLSPSSEEPFDLLDAMIDTIEEFPASYLDRSVPSHGGSLHVSRRIMVLLRPRSHYSKSWISGAQQLLEGKFH